MQVVPLSGNVDKLYPGEAYVTFNDHPGKARVDQLTTGSKQRLSHQAGRLSDAELQSVELAIKVQLALA